MSNLKQIDEDYLKRLWHRHIKAQAQGDIDLADKTKVLYYRALHLFKYRYKHEFKLEVVND